MTVTDSTSKTTDYSALGYSSSTAARTVKKSLDSGDFMKLLATQFQNQDPMKPMEDTAFIAQMAQFTSLEQTKGMAAELANLRSDQQWTAANSYLGRTVTVENEAGEEITGTVSAVATTEDGPTIQIGTESYAASSVIRVETQQPAA